MKAFIYQLIVALKRGKYPSAYVDLKHWESYVNSEYKTVYKHWKILLNHLKNITS